MFRRFFKNTWFTGLILGLLSICGFLLLPRFNFINWTDVHKFNEFSKAVIGLPVWTFPVLLTIEGVFVGSIVSMISAKNQRRIFKHRKILPWIVGLGGIGLAIVLIKSNYCPPAVVVFFPIAIIIAIIDCIFISDEIVSFEKKQ